MIPIAAPSLLTQAENAFVTSHDVTIVPLAAVEVARWGYKLHRRDDASVGRAQKARTTSATIARSGMLGLLSPTPTLADASSPRCSLTVIASTPHFRFCLRCARASWVPARKKCVVDKCHKSIIFYARRPLRNGLSEM
jgi:hypothetical protein